MNTKITDFVIIMPEPDWYSSLSDFEELRKVHASVLLVDRFHGNIITVSEKQMNELGWYKNG